MLGNFLPADEVEMAHTTPKVWVVLWGRERRAEVRVPGETASSIVLDTPAWEQWLEMPTTRSFAYPIYDEQAGYIRAFMTVRKERRTRGNEYWMAYRRSGKQLGKIYLGRSAQLSQQVLAAVAARFLALATADAELGDRKEVSAEKADERSSSGEATTR
jgi:hypothetical protein